MDFLELAARSLFLIARCLLWLAWDFLFLTIAWSVGWPMVRLLSFGRFPHSGFREYDESGTGEAFLVCGAGIGVLVVTIWLLGSHYDWRW
jgi:hypothetical protein